MSEASFFRALVDSVSVHYKKKLACRKNAFKHIRIQWNAGTACMSERVLKTFACRGLRTVGPSKFRTSRSLIVGSGGALPAPRSVAATWLRLHKNLPQDPDSTPSTPMSFVVIIRPPYTKYKTLPNPKHTSKYTPDPPPKQKYSRHTKNIQKSTNFIFSALYQESPRQTKPKKGPKRKVHMNFAHFCVCVNSGVFSLGNKQA